MRSIDAPARAATMPGAVTVAVKVVYLARLREAFGRAEEPLELTGTPPRVADVIAALRARGGAFAAELAAGQAVRVAVNHAMTRDDVALRDGDEVALLPPVTGG